MEDKSVMDKHDFTFESARIELQRVLVQSKALDDLAKQLREYEMVCGAYSSIAEFIEDTANTLNEIVINLSTYIYHIYEGE